MARDWEAQFRQWAKPPGKTEQERCDNAVSAIRNAIKASDKLNQRSITVFVQGSYRNNTNVRQDSDVDVGILCTDTFCYDLPDNTTPDMFGLNSRATYDYPQYKDEVQEALESYFGQSAVTRSNKAFDVHETSYHVEADVAPFFEHRRYNINKTYITGVELRPDNGGKVINWPEQHYENGCKKNTDTGRRYKSIVRILKALANEMTEEGKSAANVPGFLIECLGWNVPNDHFQKPTFTADVRSALAFIFNKTLKHEDCREWGEVSDLIYLFHSGQKWTWQQAHGFSSAAWDYIGFKD